MSFDSSEILSSICNNNKSHYMFLCWPSICPSACTLFLFNNLTDVAQFLYPRHLCRGVYSFRLDIRMFVRLFVRSLLSVTFVEFTSKFVVKVSLSENISLTTHQKAFIFEVWVPERISFYAMGFCPRVDAPGWG